jgi:antirestriction protein ArdC
MVYNMKFNKVEEMKKEFIEEFIQSLKEEKMIWQRGWKIILHRNYFSDIEYKGYNQLLLMYIARKKDYVETQWLTFNQAKEKGLQIKKGSKSVPIEYFSYYDKGKKEKITYAEYQQALKDDRSEEVKVINKYYNIFNIQDIEGYEPKEEETIKNDISMLGNYIKHSGIELKFIGSQPCYIPNVHEIRMPPRKQFKNDDEYYSTLLHEISHSTKKHLEREIPNDVKSKKEKYAFEELVAEISSVLLCCEFGIQLQSIQNNKAYIQNWIQKLDKDKEKYLMKAIKNANGITKYIMENIG